MRVLGRLRRSHSASRQLASRPTQSPLEAADICARSHRAAAVSSSHQGCRRATWSEASHRCSRPICLVGAPVGKKARPWATLTPTPTLGGWESARCPLRVFWGIRTYLRNLESARRIFKSKKKKTPPRAKKSALRRSPASRPRERWAPVEARPGLGRAPELPRRRALRVDGLASRTCPPSVAAGAHEVAQ